MPLSSTNYQVNSLVSLPFTTTTSSFTMPAIDSNVTISVGNSNAVGDYLYIENAGFFQLVTRVSSTSISVTNLGYSVNASPTTNISTGKRVVNSGIGGGDGGGDGGAGSGENGKDAFTETTATFTVPAVNSSVVIPVLDTYSVVADLIVYIESAGYYSVESASTTGDPTVTAINLGYPENAAPTTSITSNKLVVTAGIRGAAGTNGADGLNAFTRTNASFTVPAANSTVSITVLNSNALPPGVVIFIESAGYYSVSSVTNSTTIVATNLGYSGNASPTSTITTDKLVVTAGVRGASGEGGGAGIIDYEDIRFYL
jgi:hypothetical protein